MRAHLQSWCNVVRNVSVFLLEGGILLESPATWSLRFAKSEKVTKLLKEAIKSLQCGEEGVGLLLKGGILLESPWSLPFAKSEKVT